jgi:hypothetical protein
VQRTVLFTPEGWDPDRAVFVAQTETGTWRIGLCSLPDEVTPDEAESVAACLFQAAAEARQLQKAEAAKRG